MELTLLKMQALEYALKKSNIYRSIWYRSSDGFINPEFMSDHATEGYVARGTHLDKWIPLSKNPYLFTMLQEDICDHKLTDLLEILISLQKLIDAYPHEYFLTYNGFNDVKFEPARHANVKYRDGLVLNDVELDRAAYDLVGFEQN